MGEEHEEMKNRTRHRETDERNKRRKEETPTSLNRDLEIRGKGGQKGKLRILEE